MSEYQKDQQIDIAVGKSRNGRNRLRYSLQEIMFREGPQKQ